MKRSRWFVVAALLALLLAGCSTGSPPELEAEQLASLTRSSYGTSAASFVSSDACRFTDVQVFAWETSWSGGAGRPERSRTASVHLYQVDTCSEGGWDVIASASGWTELQGGELTMSGNLGAARLRTSIEVHDWHSGASYPVHVDLSWSGVGDTWRWKTRQHEDAGDVKYMFRADSLGRSAEVTGTLDLGALDLAIPLPGEGWMARGQHAFTVIDTGGSRPTPPEIYYFDGYPHEIFPGGSAIMYWDVAGSDPIELSIDQGVGDVTGMNAVHVAPEATTTYTLTATNLRGSTSAQFTVVVLPPPEPDDLEENDTPATASAIELDYYHGQLTITPGDVDWFVFTIDEPVGVRIDLSWTGPGAAPLGAVFDVDLDDISGSGSEFEIFLQTGTYYLAVSGYPDFGFEGHHSHSGPYALSVTATPPPPPDALEPNDDPTTATHIDLDYFSGELTLTAGDVDWFTFTLSGSATVSIYVWGSGIGTVSGLFDAALAPIHGWFDVDLDPGTYFIAVSGHPDFAFQGDHSLYGHYALFVASVAPPPPDHLEPNDFPAEATAVDLDFFSGELTITPGDVDWFTFTLAESATVVADVDAALFGSSLDSLIGLVDADFVPIVVNDDHDGLDSRIEVHLAAGTYYLAVTGFADFELVGHHGQHGFYFLSITSSP